MSTAEGDKLTKEELAAQIASLQAQAKDLEAKLQGIDAESDPTPPPKPAEGCRPSTSDASSASAKSSESETAPLSSNSANGNARAKNIPPRPSSPERPLSSPSKPARPTKPAPVEREQTASEPMAPQATKQASAKQSAKTVDVAAAIFSGEIKAESDADVSDTSRDKKTQQKSKPETDPADTKKVTKRPVARPGLVAATSAKVADGGPAAQKSAAQEGGSKTSTSDGETSQEEPDEQEHPRLSLWHYLCGESIPSWGVSTVVHMILLLAFALWMLPAQMEEEPPLPILASVSETVEDLEEVEEEVELNIEKPELEDVRPDVSEMMPDAGAADMLGEMQQVEAVVPSDFGSDLMAVSDIASVGWDLDELGQGQGKKGDGPGMASFFGVKTSGRRFMYVVDNSNSMNNGKFETAAFELLKSISQLDYNHEFYIVFYSDMAYPLFYPRSARTWVKATDDNKERVRYWLDMVHRCLKTKGEEAMTRSFKMNPDVIYLLGDGSFTDKAVPVTLGFENPHVVVHTMGFGMKAEARKGFEQIAAKFRGKFHEVDVTPAMARLSKEKNRPKNNKPNGVWGLKLNAAKKKK